MHKSSPICRTCLTVLLSLFSITSAFAEPPRVDPAKQADSPILLDLPSSGTDATKIDYDALPQIKAEHAVISPTDSTWKFQLHNYLLHHDGKYWCMWSHGPLEDMPPQHVRYSTSEDGLHWSESKVLVGPPKEGYAYIARDFWVRDNELLALVAHFKGRGAFGVDKELQLQALVWDKQTETWKPKGLVYNDAINNFAPQKLSTGEWMTTRRNARFANSMLIGGVSALDDWRPIPIVEYRTLEKFRPDEPIWWSQPDNHLVGLFRDNGGSSRLFRAFSIDQGKTWSTPVETNFPNSTSKIFSLRTSSGVRVLISNANPTVGRRQMHLSLSDDGLVFNRMALLSIPFTRPATFQYPHAIEHDGHLLVAFSRTKASIEVLKIPLKEIEALRAKEKTQ